MSSSPKLTALLVGVGGLCFASLSIAFGLHLWRDGQELREGGVAVTATVQQKLRQTDDPALGGLENYYIRCAFAGADGQTNEVELKVQSKQWRQLQESGAVKLSWLPGHLDSVKLGPMWSRQLRGLVGAVMVAFGGMAAIVFPVGGLLDFLRCRARACAAESETINRIAD